MKKLKLRYNYKLLQETFKEQYKESFKEEMIIQYKNVKLNRDFIIEGTCASNSCDDKFKKTFRMVKEQSGIFCKKCTLKNYRQKVKETNMERRGVQYPSQSEEVKQKIKETYLKTFGVEHPSQSEDVKQKKKETCLEKYGVENPSKNEEVKQKIRETCLERYGFENPLQNEEVKQKCKVTCLEKFGVEYPSQNEEVKQKKKETCLEHYGVEYPLQSEEVKQKFKETCLEIYGVEHPSQDEEVKQTFKETCLKIFGVEHPSQNPDIAEKMSKNAYKLKEYTWKSGYVSYVQGYEPFRLKDLEELGFTEKDIITNRKDMPEIWYTDVDNKKHRYYPDIYISSFNMIEEVKSTWTFKKETDRVFLKRKSVIDAQYNFRGFVYSDKGEILSTF